MSLPSPALDGVMPPRGEPPRNRSTNLRGTVRAVFAIASGNSLAAILGGIGGILAARFVDPAILGSYRAYTIPLMYLAVLHLGTFEALNRQIPLQMGRDRRDLAEEAAASAAAWNLVLSAAVSVGFAVVALLCLFRKDTPGALGWGVQALIAWGTFYGGYLGATYRTLDQFVGFARIQAIQAVISFALVFTLPVLGFAGLCFRAVLPSVAATSLLHRLRPLRMKPTVARAPFFDLIRIGLPFHFWGSLYTSVWAAVENTLLLWLAGPKGLGLFAVAVVLREGVCILPQAIHQVLTPRIVEAYGRSGHLGNATHFVNKCVPPLAVGMAVIVLGLSYALDKFVPMFLPSYVDGLALMKVSIWFAVIQTVGLPLNAFIATGSSGSYGRAIAAGLITFPVAAYLLAPHVGGILAVASGSLAGRGARTVVGYWELNRMARHEAALAPERSA